MKQSIEYIIKELECLGWELYFIKSEPCCGGPLYKFQKGGIKIAYWPSHSMYRAIKDKFVISSGSSSKMFEYAKTV